MKFTRKTYGRAIKRAEDYEFWCFLDQEFSDSGNSKWARARKLTKLIKIRALREGKVPRYRRFS